MNYISTSKAITELLEAYNRVLAWICSRRDETASPGLKSLWKSVLNDTQVRRDALVDFLRRSDEDLLSTQLQYGTDVETFDRSLKDVLASRPDELDEAVGVLASFNRAVSDYLTQLSEVAESTPAKEPLEQLARETEAAAAAESWRFRSADDGPPAAPSVAPSDNPSPPPSHSR